MASTVYGVPLEAEEGETLALATTAKYLAVKPGWREVKMYCASQWRIAHSPKLHHVLYYDATDGSYTDYVTYATDRSSSTHVPLDAMATDDYLYLGTNEPVIGFQFDIGTNVNDVAASLDMEYCSTALAVGTSVAFTDVAGDSDGTDVGPGDTLKQDGAYTFTLPSVVRSYLGSSWEKRETYGNCYWIRFKPSAALSAAVDINEIIPIYKNTNYGYREAGIEYQWTINTSKTGGYVLLATAGTPTLDITWIQHSG